MYNVHSTHSVYSMHFVYSMCSSGATREKTLSCTRFCHRIAAVPMAGPAAQVQLQRRHKSQSNWEDDLATMVSVSADTADTMREAIEA